MRGEERIKGCPASALNVFVLDKKEKHFAMDYYSERCIYCGQCSTNCRFNCIELMNEEWAAVTSVLTQLMLFIDAADMGADPAHFTGYSLIDVCLITHSFSPSLVAYYLGHDLDCQVCFLSIQPASISYGRKISPPVHVGLHGNLPYLMDDLLPKHPVSPAGWKSDDI